VTKMSRWQQQSFGRRTTQLLLLLLLLFDHVQMQLFPTWFKIEASAVTLRLRYARACGSKTERVCFISFFTYKIYIMYVWLLDPRVCYGPPSIPCGSTPGGCQPLDIDLLLISS
jgi:hypothetical protein